jgi:hypothetical protein
MIVRKIIPGFVVQEFNATTGACLSQEFVAGEQVAWETRDGDPISDGDFGIDLEGLYFPVEIEKP